MKRSISIVIIISMMLLLTSSCAFYGNKDERREVDWIPKGKLTLALRSGTYADVVKKSVVGFEEETHIYCEIIELDEDELHSNIINDHENEQGRYDICMVDGSWME